MLQSATPGSSDAVGRSNPSPGDDAYSRHSDTPPAFYSVPMLVTCSRGPLFFPTRISIRTSVRSKRQRLPKPTPSPRWDQVCAGLGSHRELCNSKTALDVAD